MEYIKLFLFGMMAMSLFHINMNLISIASDATALRYKVHLLSIDIERLARNSKGNP